MTSDSGQQSPDPMPEGRLTHRVACCLCRRPIPPAQDVFALDAEWQRRFPSMIGVLACEECVLEADWKCQDETGDYVPGHIPATGSSSGAEDFDSWSHLPEQGSQSAMAQRYPHSASEPVAKDHPRRGAARKSTSIVLAEQRTELMGLIDAWQTTRPSRARTVASGLSTRSPRNG
jgi:hypothetical protein